MTTRTPFDDLAGRLGRTSLRAALAHAPDDGALLRRAIEALVEFIESGQTARAYTWATAITALVGTIEREQAERMKRARASTRALISQLAGEAGTPAEAASGLELCLNDAVVYAPEEVERLVFELLKD
jgi:hypothetical protein